MNSVRVEKYNHISPQAILGVVFALSALPLLLVKVFPTQLEHVMSPVSYLAFHNVVEFFSIMVSLSIFGVGWFTHDQTGDRHALFLSAAFMVIGLMDFLHTLSNAAMPAFITPNSSNKSIQFWIAVRFFAACAFLGSAYVSAESKSQWLSRTNLMTMSLVITGSVFTVVVFFPSFAPVMFISGLGLTPFKVVSEYVIIFLLVLASIAYWKRMTRTQDRLLLYFVSSFIMSIFSELTFSTYVSVFDTYNVLGHIYKVVAFLLIYWSIFIAAVKAPHKRLMETRGKLQEEVIERRRVEAEIRMHRDHIEDLVKQRTVELESSNQELKRENTERKQAEAALNERTVQLENANKELESFSYTVSHDLKAPLRAIDGYSRMMLKKCGSTFDEEATRMFNVIRSNTAKMGLLIDDLLSFSRVLRERMNLSEIDMNRLVSEVWEDIRAANQERELQLKAANIMPGYGDLTLIRQVLFNLISNAVKFTKNRKPGTIELSSYMESDNVVYCVKDNGVGFDMAYYDKLFGIFQRLHGDEAYEGTGIGLAIVQRIVQHHGGRVWAEGKVDEGATFCFTLPRH